MVSKILKFGKQKGSSLTLPMNGLGEGIFARPRFRRFFFFVAAIFRANEIGAPPKISFFL